MTQASDVAERFNRISDIYDETREPLTEEAVDRLVGILVGRGAGRILEAGVGTGRIAAPLQKRNFEVVGADISRNMLQKARMKGVKGLLMADANYLPFTDESFEYAMISHVLHLVEDPAETFASLARITKNSILAIFRKHDDQTGGESEGRVIWQALRVAAEELGYSFPHGRDEGEGFRREAEFLRSYPPNEVFTLQDVSRMTTLEERLDVIEKRAFGYPASLPEDVLHEVVAKARTEVDLKKEVPYRRVEQVGLWRLNRG